MAKRKTSKKKVVARSNDGGALLAFIVLAGFIVLAIKSFGFNEVNHGYSNDEISQLDRLVQSLNEEPKPVNIWYDKPHKKGYTKQQADGLMAAYSLTDADLAKPVAIYR